MKKIKYSNFYGKHHSEETKQKLREIQLGVRLSEEHRKNISNALKGHKISEETKRKIGLSNSISLKGKKSWNTGLTKDKDKRLIYERPGAFKKGIHPKTEIKAGDKMSLKVREKMSISHRGDKAPNWQGGITELNFNIRGSFKYRAWRDFIFIKDKYTCQECGCVGKRIQAHHKKAFSLILRENNIKTFEEAMNCKEIWDINNGKTLCIDCHKETDTYLLKARWGKNNEKQN